MWLMWPMLFSQHLELFKKILSNNCCTRRASQRANEPARTSGSNLSGCAILIALPTLPSREPCPVPRAWRADQRNEVSINYEYFQPTLRHHYLIV